MLEKLLKFAADLTALCRRHELNVGIWHYGGGDPELVVEPAGDGWYVVSPGPNDEGGVISYWQPPTTWVVHRRQEQETPWGRSRPMLPTTSAPTLESARALVVAESPGVTWRDEAGRYLYLDGGVVRETPPRLVWGDVGGEPTWMIQAK